MKYFALTAIYTIAAFLISSAIDIIWAKYVTNGISFHVYLGFIYTINFVTWIPSIILYGTIGWFFKPLFKNNSVIWLLTFAGFVFILETLLVSHWFTKHADVVEKVWAYFEYVVPSLAVLGGYMLKMRLTR